MYIMNKVIYLLTTVNKLKEALDDVEYTERLDHLYDSIAHTAPEIVDSRWQRIYRFCTTYVTDQNNPNHMKCYNIYMKSLAEYNKLFN